MAKDFGGRLASALRSRGMTQKELAESTGLTQAAVSRYISGAREPRAITVASIARALDITPQELLGTDTRDEFDESVRLVARNASSLSSDQREMLIEALMRR